MPTFPISVNTDTKPLLSNYSSQESSSSRQQQQPTLTNYEQQKLQRHLQLQSELPREFQNVDSDKFHIHKIDRINDTLTSLAVSYHVQEEDIKRINRFSDLDLYAKDYLLIPLRDVNSLLYSNERKRVEVTIETEQVKQHRMVQKFAKFHNVSPDEAHYYLNYAEWNLEEALRHFNEDKEWETNRHRGVLRQVPQATRIEYERAEASLYPL